MNQTAPYYLGFTAVSLRPELARIVAEAFLTTSDWELAREHVLASNAIQSKSRASAVRVERELRQRLQTLTQHQLETLAHSSTDDRAAMAWLAMIKFSAFPFEFAADVLRDKLASQDEVLRPSDYEAFVHERSVSHPEVAGLKESTRTKIRGVLLRMLFEAGVLIDGPFLGTVQRAIISPTSERAIRADNPRWLAGFLVPDQEIQSI